MKRIAAVKLTSEDYSILTGNNRRSRTHIVTMFRESWEIQAMQSGDRRDADLMYARADQLADDLIKLP
ncbi:MAG: hypothetical protein ACREU2_00695 [Steroidobacteraceae bacterium]